MSRLHVAILAALALAATPLPGHAQEHGQHHHQPSPTPRHAEDDPHAGHAGHAVLEDPHAGHAAHAAPEDPHAGRGTARPHAPIPPVTDADRAAAFPPLTRHVEHPSAFNTLLLVERLEAWDEDPGTGQAWEVTGWAGTDINRLWLRSEGERVGGRTEGASVDLLYGRSVGPWWDLVAGLRHDSLPGPSDTRLALGVQGLAPYLFEVEATAYLDDEGHASLQLEAGYDLLLTNRLVLQPEIEMELSGARDPGRGVGTGLASVEAGLRLRYEVTRQFAPYLGVVHERAFGDTVDLRRQEGHPARDTRLVAGVRIWF